VAAWTSDSARAGRRRGRAGRRTRSCGRRWRARPCGGARRRTFPIRSAARGDLVRLTVDAVGVGRSVHGGLDGSVQVIAVSPAGAAAPPRALPMAETAARPLRGQLSTRRSRPARCCSRRRCRPAPSRPRRRAAG
jgi:hypothetical protein